MMIKNIGWGNAAFIRENLKLGNDNVILGTNNHDTPSVLSCAKDKEISKKAFRRLDACIQIKR